VSSSIVLIGPADALPGLRDRVDAGGELHTFTDSEALEALDHIVRSKPRIVAIDQEFSTTSRGTALINRIKSDPSLGSCEVRVISHDSAVSRVVVRRNPAGGTAIAVDEPKPVLDYRGTRRAPRVRIKEGVDITIDGNVASLVDLSTAGAQVLSAKMLKPNQRVRLVLSDSKTTIRCSGAVAWASFEMPKGSPAHYRAGIEFAAGELQALAGYAERNKRS